jgi:hypothetical protein
LPHLANIAHCFEPNYQHCCHPFLAPILFVEQTMPHAPHKTANLAIPLPLLCENWTVNRSSLFQLKRGQVVDNSGVALFLLGFRFNTWNPTSEINWTQDHSKYKRQFIPVSFATGISTN